MMKKYITAFVLLVTTLTTVAQNRSFKDLVGRWEAVDSDNNSGGLEIEDSTRVYLVYGDERKQIVSYKTDFQKSPARFDFTIKNGTESFELRSLVQFINDDLLQWQVFEDDVQPAHFKENEGTLVYLRRKK